MKSIITAIFIFCFASCTKHPNPGPALEKVNGATTVNADDAKGWGEDKTWDDMAYAPKMPVVYFEFDSDKIKDAYAEDISYAAMATKAKWSCQVDGFASEEGTEEYNLALGERRAMAVGTYLASFQGITVHETSYGEEKPASSDQALNRRVEIKCR